MKGSLARAVLTDEKRQWRQASGLLFAEAAEVPECYLVHGMIPLFQHLTAKKLPPAFDGHGLGRQVRHDRILAYVRNVASKARTNQSKCSQAGQRTL